MKDFWVSTRACNRFPVTMYAFLLVFLGARESQFSILTSFNRVGCIIVFILILEKAFSCVKGISTFLRPSSTANTAVEELGEKSLLNLNPTKVPILGISVAVSSVRSNGTTSGFIGVNASMTLSMFSLLLSMTPLCFARLSSAALITSLYAT